MWQDKERLNNIRYMKIFNSTTKVTINGVSYEGKNVSINGDQITIDGNDVSTSDKNISIVIHGDIDELNVDSCDKVEVDGDVGKLSTRSGSVSCKNVNGNIETSSGTVRSGNITGDVKTMSGSVRCGDISGSVSTMSGSIKI